MKIDLDIFILIMKFTSDLVNILMDFKKEILKEIHQC